MGLVAYMLSARNSSVSTQNKYLTMPDRDKVKTHLDMRRET